MALPLLASPGWSPNALLLMPLNQTCIRPWVKVKTLNLQLLHGEKIPLVSVPTRMPMQLQKSERQLLCDCFINK